MSKRTRSYLTAALIVTVLLGTAGCIAGDGKYSEEKPANFWSGLFHGVIGPVTLFISLFTGNIDMYEKFNVGWGYDAGFFLGLAIVLGGGASSRRSPCRVFRPKKCESKWDTFGDEIEREVKQGVVEALGSKHGDEGSGDEDCKEVARKVAEKIKRKLKEWAEKD